jgi:hypothetical protein
MRVYESRGLNFYRLCFARWLVQQGRISEQPAATEDSRDGSACAPARPRHGWSGFWHRLREFCWPCGP